MKDETEIETARSEAADRTYKSSKYPGMTYEEGLRDALDWVLGDYEGDLFE